MRRLAAFGLGALALLVAALAPGTAGASITVGSDLSGPLFGKVGNCAPIPPPCSNMLAGVHRGNAFPPTSPTSGTVTAFRIKAGGPDTVTFRLGTVERTVEAKATTSATGSTVTLPGAGVYAYPAELPIAVGESPGIDASSYTAFGACFQGGYYYSYNPPLALGAPPLAAGANSTCELMVNVTIEPSNSFSLGKIQRNKLKGTAKLEVSLPGPGKVTVGGKTVKSASKSALEFGPLMVPVTPKGEAKKKLDGGGTAKVGVKVEFAPSGGAPSTRSKKIKLVRKSR
jgi:hypothetical protein